MVKELGFAESFTGIDIKSFFDIVLGTPRFTELFHVAQGDKETRVGTWEPVVFGDKEPLTESELNQFVLESRSASQDDYVDNDEDADGNNNNNNNNNYNSSSSDADEAGSQASYTSSDSGRYHEIPPRWMKRTTQFFTQLEGMPDVVVRFFKTNSSKCTVTEYLTWNSHESRNGRVVLDGFFMHTVMKLLDLPMKDSIKMHSNWRLDQRRRATTTTTTTTQTRLTGEGSQRDLHLQINVRVAFDAWVWKINGMVETLMESNMRKSFTNLMIALHNEVDNWKRAHREIPRRIPDAVSPPLNDELSESATDVSSVTSMSEGFLDAVSESGSTSPPPPHFQSLRATSPSRVSGTSSAGAAQTDPLSTLIHRSYNVAALKNELIETRSLMSKTEQRVVALEREFANRKLDITAARYLERVEQLWQEQKTLLEELARRERTLHQFLNVDSAKGVVKRRWRWFSSKWFLGFLAGTFTVLTPLAMWALLRNRSSSNPYVQRVFSLFSSTSGQSSDGATF